VCSHSPEYGEPGLAIFSVTGEKDKREEVPLEPDGKKRDV
jgi:hypothetical protein